MASESEQIDRLVRKVERRAARADGAEQRELATAADRLREARMHIEEANGHNAAPVR